MYITNKKKALIKVTIVGYYPISEKEVENYDIAEFDPVRMAEIDQEEYVKYRDLEVVIGLLDQSMPESVTFEAVDAGDVSKS